MQKGAVLALDYGKKRIGVATGDFEVKIAFPRALIENKSFDFVLAKLRQLVEEFQIMTIVIGLPLNMQEEQAPNAIMAEVKNFVVKLAKYFPDIEIQFFDERLSSFEADQIIKSLISKGKKKGLSRDAFSAVVILQRFFDKI